MYSNATLAGLHRSGSMGTLTTTGGNETLKVITPSAIVDALLQTKALSGRYNINEVWFPVGIWYTCTTGITVTNAKVTLRKNGVSAATGGVATLPIVAATTAELFAPFTAWTFAAAPAAGDVWSVLVTTTSTAGVVNPTFLAYGVGAYSGVTDGIAQ